MSRAMGVRRCIVLLPLSTGMVRVLLKCGSDLRKRNHDGATPAKAAKMAGHQATAEVLRGKEELEMHWVLR